VKIKNYLKILRTRRGISQSELAKRLSKTRQAVHGFESDSYVPSMDVATEIAEILNVPISTLFSPAEASSMMHVPIALIANCDSNSQRNDLGKRLQELFPSDRLQPVVRAREGSCPRWDWDPKGERTDGKPGIAIACNTQRQFDEFQNWLHDNGCKSIDCGIGMDRFPTIAYFAADWKHAREGLSTWEPEGDSVSSPTPAIDEIYVDQETTSLIEKGLLDAHAEAIAFANKCYTVFGQKDYGDHHSKMAVEILELRKKLKNGFRVIRWSSDYSLLTQSMFAAEVKARNDHNMDLAKKYHLAQKVIEDQTK